MTDLEKYQELYFKSKEIVKTLENENIELKRIILMMDIKEFA